jgi:hypothetical protein
VKRLLAALLLLLASASAPAHAQFNGCPPGFCNVAPGAYGPGDVVPSAQVVYYGLRAYTAAIAAAATHKLINISRASDSHTCDIIVATNRGLGNTANCSTGGDNGQSASGFCNATTCVVVTLYDQVATHDMTQATNANRPTLTFNCLGGLPCMTFGTNQALVQSAPTGSSQPLTFILVGKRTAQFTAQSTVAGANGAQPEVGGASSANTWIMYAGSVANVASVSDSVWHAFDFVFNGASSIANTDGTEVTTNPSTNVVNATMFVGNGNWNGTVTEFGMWASGFTGTQRTNMCKNQQAYWGGGGNFGATC